MNPAATNQSAPPQGEVEEKTRSLEEFVKATLNILEDSNLEKERFGETQRAILNIFQDFGDESLSLKETQRATSNLLEDFDTERKRAEVTTALLNDEITERKQAEKALLERTAQLLASNKELEAFSYSVSHDLRTPLRAIDGFSRELLENVGERLDENARADLQRVRDGTQRMGQLIDDLLELSRLSRAELVHKQVNLSEIAQKVISSLKETQPDRQVDVVIAPQLFGHGDSRLLTVVLENLLGNAWKFSAKKTLAKIEFGSAFQNGVQVFHVRDNGAGFNMDHAGKLFGVFQRLHGQDEFEGTGIGLSFVQRVVQRHGGRAWGEGKVNEGATFYFSLSSQKKEVTHDPSESS